mmetsp:Transcript_71966/g.227493  ORF Transcript_71966/g.227493 Transcript_71966/m.227493 type:complete len:327 (+) Transcript_71966:1366-2346(+)
MMWAKVALQPPPRVSSTSATHSARSAEGCHHCARKRHVSSGCSHAKETCPTFEPRRAPPLVHARAGAGGRSVGRTSRRRPSPRARQRSHVSRIVAPPKRKTSSSGWKTARAPPTPEAGVSTLETAPRHRVRLAADRASWSPRRHAQARAGTRSHRPAAKAERHRSHSGPCPGAGVQRQHWQRRASGRGGGVPHGVQHCPWPYGGPGGSQSLPLRWPLCSCVCRVGGATVPVGCSSSGTSVHGPPAHHRVRLHQACGRRRTPRTGRSILNSPLANPREVARKRIRHWPNLLRAPGHHTRPCGPSGSGGRARRRSCEGCRCPPDCERP